MYISVQSEPGNLRKKFNLMDAHDVAELGYEVSSAPVRKIFIIRAV